MVYVNKPREVADFWTKQIGFVELQENKLGNGVLSVEVAPRIDSDTSLVLFDREVVANASPELSLGTPSILFSSYNLQQMYDDLRQKGVKVGEIVEMGGQLTFNFADIEGNYFAVREVTK